MMEKQYAKAMLAGSIAGLGVWLAYATVEFILFSLAPLLLQPETVLNAPTWRIQAITLGVYVLIGSVLGSVAGLALMAFGAPRAGEWKATRCVVVLLFLAIFAGNLVADGRLPGGEQVSLALAGLGILAGLASLRSEHWNDRLGFLVEPLTASLFVMAPPWISTLVFGGRSSALRLGVILPVLLAAAVMSWWFGKRRLPILAVPINYTAAMAGLFLVACGAGWALSAGPPKLPPRKSVASGQRPNVVLIVMDTVRADHTSLYGYERDTTPFLRELAKEATVYRNAVAVSDFTLPMHASMFTGLYPRTHGAHFAPPIYQPLPEHFTTMAEVLRANDYRTMAVVANSGYLSSSFGLAQGFEVFDRRASVPVDSSVHDYPHLRRTVATLLEPVLSMMEAELVTRRADEITGEANLLLDQVGAATPYFLFVNYMDAHSPYVPPEPFRSAYPCSDPTVARWKATKRIRHDLVSGKRAITSEEQQCLEAYYDGGIQYIDAQLRSLTAALKARGDWETTMLIVTGDHGEAFGRRDHVGHGGVSVYQEEIGIPLLVKYPGGNPSLRIDDYASQVDLLPTVLDVVGISPLSRLAGVSLRSGTGRSRRAVVSVSYPDEWLSSQNPSFRRTEEALLFEGKKLVVSNIGKRELFDLSQDRSEEHNLYQDGDPQVAALTAMLEQWKRAFPAGQSARTLSRDHATMERLKSLGYAQ